MERRVNPKVRWEIDSLVDEETRALCEEMGFADPILKCRIHRDDYAPGYSYVVTFGPGRWRERGRWCEHEVESNAIALDVSMITNDHKADLKGWLRRVLLVYTNKNDKKSKIVVAINAINSNNCIGGTRGGRKGKVIPKELLQICIGHHCILIKLEPDAVGHSLKAFLREFFQDARFMFVGLGIKEIADELHRDFKDTHLKDLAFIPKPVDLKELAAYDGRDDLERLVRHVLDINYEKPTTLCWYGRDLVMWSSVDVYLMALIGRRLTN